MNEIVERYLACWNETNPSARRTLIDQTWCGDATYIDPLAEVHGVAAIDSTIAAVQGQFPGMVFSQVGPVDAHHRQARFGWGLGAAGQDPLVIGFDVAVFAEDGRISTVLGFLDKVPA